MKILGRVIDERFLAHRQKSTSIAGLAGAFVALGIFYYRYFARHVWSWDLFAVIATMVVVKLSIMIWSYLTD